MGRVGTVWHGLAGVDLPPIDGRAELCSWQGCLVLGGALVAQRGVYPLTVVEQFDEGVDRCRGLLSGGEVAVVGQLSLDGGEEAFHRRVVVAVAGAAHGTGDAVAVER